MSSQTSSELYDPLFHTPQDDLYKIYRRLRDEFPVYHCGLRGVWCLSRFEDVQAAARDWQTFSNANGVDLDVPGQFFEIGDFLDSDPPRHDVLRKVVRPFFVPKQIARLQHEITQRVQAIVKELAHAQESDLAQDFAWALPIWVICRLLGVPSTDDEMVHTLVTDLVTRDPGEDAPPECSLDALRELHVYAEGLAEQKRRAPGEDLMSHMVAGEAVGAPRREEIPGMMVLLFTAGSETTAALIGNTLFLLAQHADVQAALRREPSELIDPVIEESLRTESPIQYLARHTQAPVRVHDVEIPADADVVLLYGSANRDERHFDRAEELDISRPAQRHLAFGEGIHFCLGAPLARLEARLALPAFLRAVSSYEIQMQQTERFCNHMVRGFQRLPTRID
ncbi:MAG: cytochrome P450 [Solirubrobacteraceae bacterium]